MFFNHFTIIFQYDTMIATIDLLKGGKLNDLLFLFLDIIKNRVSVRSIVMSQTIGEKVTLIFQGPQYT